MPNLANIETQCLPNALPHAQREWHVAQRQKTNQQDIQNWSRIQSLTDWQTYCTPRLEALRASLGQFPTPPSNITPHITRSHQGNGYKIENIVFESRKSIFVSANRYLPNPLREEMPGILLVHSHHNPKVQGELQDMGILWARSGCIVLVIDQFAYGDRRDHSFAPRQDYWFRDITGKQLHTLGDSLMGWMVWDIHRSVDLLLSHPNIAPDKIIALGSVAGGGDPCAVASALDPRIACTIPFNFGGPQPESPFPLPEDAETTFNYLGNGSWESTRNLRLSGRDGFLPWLVVGSIAPRKLVYAHEFEWDQARDPVWQRLKQIYAWHNASENLDFTQGFGQLQGRPPQASHCNNIGVPHRQRIYTALQKWFGIAPPSEEVQERYPDDDLQSLTPTLRNELRVPATHQIFNQIGKTRASQISKNTDSPSKKWAQLLGNTEPTPVTIADQKTTAHQGITIEHTVLKTDMPLPVITLLPPQAKHIIVSIAQSGKHQLLAHRMKDYETLLNQGVGICLPDLRGTGETAPEGPRTFRSTASALSANALMFGQTSLGNRLNDLRAVLAYLRDIHENLKLSLWGDSLAPTNARGLADPLYNSDTPPHQAEPAGGLIALFATLFEPDIQALALSGMIPNYQSLLTHTYTYVPHDAIIPGALQAGDLCTITAHFAPKPLCLSHMVDGRNCPLTQEEITNQHQTTRNAYQDHPQNLVIDPTHNISQWFGQNLL